jgi:hypothetical protein
MVATDMTERLANEIVTSLSAAINASQTSITVTSATGFPAANFRIRIDNELMLVTGVAGTTWTVTRAVESTTVASHAILADVSHILTAGGLAQALAEAVPAAGSITTAMLAAGAVTQVVSASPTTNTPTTNSGTAADMPEMTVTVISTGGPLLITWSAQCQQNTVGVDGVFDTYVAGGFVSRRQFTGPGAAYNVFMSQNLIVSGIGAGSVTVKVQWFVTGGILSSSNTFRSLQVVELKR